MTQRAVHLVWDREGNGSNTGMVKKFSTRPSCDSISPTFVGLWSNFFCKYYCEITKVQLMIFITTNVGFYEVLFILHFSNFDLFLSLINGRSHWLSNEI